MSTFAEAREHYEPLCEVYVAPETLGEGEWLLFGEILPRAMDNIDASFETKHRIPVQSRSAEELLKWIWSYPDELNRALEADLSESLGDAIQIREWYPPTPEEREGVSR